MWMGSVGADATGAGQTALGERRCAFKRNLFLFLLYAVAAHAQQETKDLGDASLQELGKIQVYGASKHLQDVRDAPSSVTVITGEEIQMHGYRTLADILRSVRGFYVTYDRDYSFVGVRGFGEMEDWNSRVLLLVDGHRMNNNVIGQAMLGTEFPVDVDLIDRVEIIRGPSSSLYGADAFFAVINVITRKAPQLKGVELSFAPASFGTYQGRVSLGARYQGADMLLSGTVYHSRGPTLFFPEFNNPATNNGITSDTDSEGSDKVMASVSYRGFTLQGLFSSRDKLVPTGFFGSLFNDPRTRNLESHQYLDLSYEHAVGETWQLTARTSYDQVRLQARQVYPPAQVGGSVVMDAFSFRGNWWNGEVKLSRVLLEKHKISVGTDLTANLRQDQGDYTSVGNVFQAIPASSTIWALYGQDEYTITHKLTMSAGVRYDHYSNFGGTTNPRLGLIFRLFQPTTVKVLYGSAFRPPEPYEIEPGFGPFFENDPKLQPETIHSIEGVVEQALGPHIRVSASVFQNRIDRLIEVETDPVRGVPVYENSGGAHAQGVEFELDGRLPDGLETTASYSYTDATDAVSDLPLDNSPRHLGKLDIAVPLLRRKLFASLDAQYTSPRQTAAGTSVSGFAVFNATLLGHTLGKHLDFSASVYNIFNKQYFDPGGPGDPENAIQQDGRNFRIKLTGRF